MHIQKVDGSKQRWWDWMIALLVIIALQVSVARLAATSWTEDLDTAQVLTFFGAILGMALGLSIFNRYLVIFLGIAYGTLAIPWQLGLTMESGIRWKERLVSLWGRLEVVANELVRREPITDNLLFIFLMSCLFWALSVYVGYIVIRHAHIWRTVLPAGLVAYVIHSFDPLLARRTWFLAFYLFFSLLIVARLVYLKRRAKWRVSRVHIPPDIGYDLTRFSVLIATVLVLFAWNAPVVADTLQPAAQIWQSASRPWLSLKDRFGFAFAALRASVGIVDDHFGETLPLGLGASLTDEVVFEVEAPVNPPEGLRYFWRARVYGTYEDNQWNTTLEASREVLPDSRDFAQTGVDIRPEASFVFFPHHAIGTLFVVPQPLWVSRPVEAYMVNNPDGTVDLSNLNAVEFIRPGERYEVRSSLSAVTIPDLRAAGTDYPQWILDEYLQLPADITPRTLQLAQSIAAGLDNPYDITAAVTLFLRDTIEYTTTIDTPPDDQERIDWLLFDYQKGYCNYYATAEVLLLRSLGIPARLAVGFAQGERQIEIMELPPAVGEGAQPEITSDVATFIVRNRDAHAWPEVYFPGIGWVEFEPTSGQEPLFRPSGEEFAGDEQPINNQNPLPENFDEGMFGGTQGEQSQAGNEQSSSAVGRQPFWTLRNIIMLLIGLAAIGSLVFVIWQIRHGVALGPWFEQRTVRLPAQIERGLYRLGLRPPAFLRYWTYFAALPLLSKSYIEINRALSRLGHPPRIQDTPSERTEALIIILPRAAEPARRLLAEYQLSAYSPNVGDQFTARQAGREIRWRSYLARLERLLSRFQEPPNSSAS